MRFRDIRGIAAIGSDGEYAGHLDDVLFDDRTWLAQYLVIGSGHWRGRRVLVSPESVRSASSNGIEFGVTAAEIAESPQYDSHKPVSRQMELRYRDYVTWMAYWVSGFSVPFTLDADRAAKDEAAHGHLRSAAAVMGHHVMALDGEAGTIRDYVIDTDRWYIADLVVHAGHWPHESEALMSPYWVHAISWARSTVDVHATRSSVLHPSEPKQITV